MIQLFFRDNREPVELVRKYDQFQEESDFTKKEKLILDSFEMRVWSSSPYYHDKEVTAQCSHIVFPNGKFIWEVGKCQ